MIDYCEVCEEVANLGCCALCGRGGLCSDCQLECEASHEDEEPPAFWTDIEEEDSAR